MEINGNEKLIEPTPSAGSYILGYILFVLFLPVFVIGLVYLIDEGMDSVTFVFYVLYCLATGIPAFRLTLKSKPKLKQEYAKAQEIYSYFQKNIPILTSFDEDRHENLGATTKKANDRDAALFDVYMEAYKSNADAIILNSNDMTGSVGVADVQMGMGTALNVTQNGYNILATLVKYK